MDYSELKGWESAGLIKFSKSFDNSCKKIAYIKNKNDLQKEIFKSCQVFSKIELSSDKIRQFLEEDFYLYKINDESNPEGLFTGYYLIKLKGSFEASEKYRYPLYSFPSNKKILDASRYEIESLKSKIDLEPIMFVEDKARLFFLHIQGSGIVEFENGEEIYVTYAGKNNHKYTSIGKYFLKNNIFSKDEISAPKIMKWLENNKGEEANKIMNLNESFIFFKNAEGKIKGAADVPLTSEASIAIDKEIFPMHLPFWVETDLPTNQPLNFLSVSQDTGSAIKGEVRADIFFGQGEYAEEMAGGMKQKGRMFILLPKRIHPLTYF